MKLLTNWFSPFARKVALALEYKGISFEAIDGLARENHELLWQLNQRGEVPALIDGDLIITNSPHIMSYLDEAYPERPILPTNAANRARARALERIFDTRVDPILVNCSLWSWAEREDTPPKGLHEAGQLDLDLAFAETETLLDNVHSFAFGNKPTLADFALWPHLAAVEPLGFSLDPVRFAKTSRLLAEMKATKLFRDDAKRTRNYISVMNAETIETKKIAWRGDRIEWMLGRGFHDWFWEEIRSDRVIWPIVSPV